MTSQAPSIGRVVHFVMPNGQHRPARIVQVWPEDRVNIIVDLDGPNDIYFNPESYGGKGMGTPLMSWQGSVEPDHSDEPASNTWHWPEFVPSRD